MWKKKNLRQFLLKKLLLSFLFESKWLRTISIVLRINWKKKNQNFKKWTTRAGKATTVVWFLYKIFTQSKISFSRKFYVPFLKINY